MVAAVIVSVVMTAIGLVTVAATQDRLFLGRNIFDRKILVKFIYFEKATKFYKIFTYYLSYVLPVKWLVEISQNFVALSEYMNFNTFFR